ncbi:A disintegrin and metalloproteinase with thrombospondin motifs 1-like [Gordionus sp. m RMFG-2023]|uniref:A disintegrin and metalloproteinase with thrombospondin motifs 1-like n=1 Tax=Gordionus sp. m RMFG-2023 TaxID=3053472 RepID=UPI0031FD69A9
MRCLANGNSFKDSPPSAPVNISKTCIFLKYKEENFTLDFENSKCDAIRCKSEGYISDVPEFLDMHHCNLSDNHLSKSDTGSVCSKGTCVLETTIEVKAQADPWSSWSPWSPCRGDDVIGIQKRNRKCEKSRLKLGEKKCQGNNTEYKVCHNKVSRKNKKNMALCKEHNSASIYSAEADYPCRLTCFVGPNFTDYGNAADGTLIKTDNTISMCLDGSIIPVGCDDEFYSTAKWDKCGICNGDNSRCYPFEAEEMITLTKVRTNITYLKEGTTFLLFRLTSINSKGSDGAIISLVLNRNGKNYKGNFIKKLTDITYEKNKDFEVITSEKLASPLTIQILKNLAVNMDVGYKLRYAIPK